MKTVSLYMIFMKVEEAEECTMLIMMEEERLG